MGAPISAPTCCHQSRWEQQPFFSIPVMVLLALDHLTMDYAAGLPGRLADQQHTSVPGQQVSPQICCLHLHRQALTLHAALCRSVPPSSAACRLLPWQSACQCEQERVSLRLQRCACLPCTCVSRRVPRSQLDNLAGTLAGPGGR